MKKGETEISVSTLRDELPSLLARVQLLGESFAIMKHGKVAAVIRPIDGGDEETDGGRQSKKLPAAARRAGG